MKFAAIRQVTEAYVAVFGDKSLYTLPVRDAAELLRMAGWKSEVKAVDGFNSGIRRQYQDALGLELETCPSKFIWFGTDQVFEVQ